VFDGFKVLKGKKASDLKSSLFQPLSGLNESHLESMLHPTTDILIPQPFMDYLAKLRPRRKRPMHVVTSLPCLELGMKPIYGSGYPDTRVSFLSTYPIDRTISDKENRIKRMVVASIHETGHSLGLFHHENGELTYRKKLCPMNIEGGGVFEGSGMTSGEIAELTDTILCDNCYSRLSIPRPEAE
jgi:hypothetical protein